MHARALLVATLLLFASLGGCKKGEFNRDGAGCSDENRCPPGQICSTDGQCLFPCPVSDCVNEVCGCTSHLEYMSNREYLCMDDGLCHIFCWQGNSCENEMVCGSDGFCLPQCGQESPCPNGALCVQGPEEPYCQAPPLDAGI